MKETSWRLQRSKMGSAQKKRALKGWLFIAPSLIGVLIFSLIPMADTVRRSFLSVGGSFVGLSNYSKIFTNEAFHLAAGNTIRFMLICIPLLLVLSFFVALLARKASPLFKTSFLVPLAIPVASLSMLWQVIFHGNGLLNGGLSALGGPTVDWMNSDWAFWVLVFSYVWKNTGYNMVLFLAGLSNISAVLYEAAQVDGANGFQKMIYITLPSLTPIFYTVAVLSLLNSFKVFREAYLVAGNYPHGSMYILQHLFNNWFTGLDMDKLTAGATVVAVCVFGLILLLQKAWGGDRS